MAFQIRKTIATLEGLVQITIEVVRNHVQESAWFVSAAAQRVNADANVKSCIAVGMQKYWRGLAAGTYFADRRLDACVMVIHQDIVGIWYFWDEDEVSFLSSFGRFLGSIFFSLLILRRPSFKNAVLLLVQDLADANGPSPGSDTTKNLECIKPAYTFIWSTHASSRISRSFRDVCQVAL